MTEKATREFKAQTHNPAQDAVPAINRPKDLKFSVTHCKLYVPVVTLQTEYQNQLYKKSKTGISADFTWSKYSTSTDYLFRLFQMKKIEDFFQSITHQLLK